MGCGYVVWIFSYCLGFSPLPQHPGRLWTMECVQEAPSPPEKRPGLEIDHLIQSSAGISIGAAALVHRTSAIAVYTGTTFYHYYPIAIILAISTVQKYYFSMKSGVEYSTK